MATRTQARETIVSLLYSQDIDNSDQEDFERWKNELLDHKKIRNKQREFAEKVIQGLFLKLEKIDKIMVEYLDQNWGLDNIGKVEKAVLRLGIYELVFAKLDKGIAISEAIGIVKKYGSEKSLRLINGVLDSVANSVNQKKEQNTEEK